MKGRGEDDGAEDPAASGAQHQLRASSGGAASPGGARQQHGGLVGRRFGQPAAWRRRCGGHDNPDPGAPGLANIFFCNYVHAMNIFLLIEFKCQL